MKFIGKERKEKNERQNKKQIPIDNMDVSNKTVFPMGELMTLKKRLAIEPLLPPQYAATPSDLPSPLSAVQTQAKKAKSNQQLRADEKAATVASMRNDTRPEELRWARGLSGLNVSYPCKVLSHKAKYALNDTTKTLLRNEDLLDKDLVCFFVGKQLYFSAVPDHDALPLFVPGDEAYVTRCAQPATMKTASRTTKRLLAQLPGVVATFDALYQYSTSMVAAEALLAQVHNKRMEQNALDMERRRSIATQMRLEALLASTTRIELDAPLFHSLIAGDTIIFYDDVSRAKVIRLVEGTKGKFIQIGSGKMRYLSKDSLIRRVIPSFEAEAILGDVFKSDVEYVTSIGSVSSFHFLIDEDHTFVKKCMNQVQRWFNK